jgi:hypothetical protein
MAHVNHERDAKVFARRHGFAAKRIDTAGQRLSLAAEPVVGVGLPL